MNANVMRIFAFRGISGGIDTTDATATANDIYVGKTAYANKVKVTGVFNHAPKINEPHEVPLPTVGVTAVLT